MLPIRFKRIKHVQMLEKQVTDRLKLFLQTFRRPAFPPDRSVAVKRLPAEIRRKNQALQIARVSCSLFMSLLCLIFLLILLCLFKVIDHAYVIGENKFVR